MNKELLIHNNFILYFKDKAIESGFKQDYDESFELSLRYGFIISILSWFSGIGLTYFVLP